MQSFGKLKKNCVNSAKSSFSLYNMSGRGLKALQLIFTPYDCVERAEHACYSWPKTSFLSVFSSSFRMQLFGKICENYVNSAKMRQPFSNPLFLGRKKTSCLSASLMQLFFCKICENHVNSAKLRHSSWRQWNIFSHKIHFLAVRDAFVPSPTLQGLAWCWPLCPNVAASTHICSSHHSLSFSCPGYCYVCPYLANPGALSNDKELKQSHLFSPSSERLQVLQIPIFLNTLHGILQLPTQ